MRLLGNGAKVIANNPRAVVRQGTLITHLFISMCKPPQAACKYSDKQRVRRSADQTGDLQRTFTRRLTGMLSQSVDGAHEDAARLARQMICGEV
jgi:surfactin synthase thioesterase subunit